MTSSYQALARYHDERQTNRMLDIRQQLRRDMFSSRSETKQAQLLKNRRLLYSSVDYEEESEYDGQGHDEPDFDCHPSDPLDDQSSWNTLSWENLNQLPPSNAPSPSLSHRSESSLGQARCDNSTWSRSRCNLRISSMSRREILQVRKRATKSSYDAETIRNEYETLKGHIVSGSADPKAIGFIMCSSWTVLARAMNGQDVQLARDALSFLTRLIMRNFVRISDILFLLQQGLILTIRDAMSRLGPQQPDVVTLLMSIIVTEPRSVSYIIELISDTDIVRILEDFIEYGTESEASLASRFYNCLFDIQTGLSGCEDFIPVVPETLSRTTSPEELAKIFCLSSSIKRVIRPNFISAMMGRFYKPLGGVNPDLLTLATVITANCLRLVYISSTSDTKDIPWACSIIGEFETSHFNQLLSRMIQSQTTYRLTSKNLGLVKRLLECYYETTVALSSVLSLSSR